MKLYRLTVVVRGPNEETEDKYLAEVPALPGCRAWGDTPGQALDYVYSVATQFLESYREHCQPLPPDVEAVGIELPEGGPTQSEIVLIG